MVQRAKERDAAAGAPVPAPSDERERLQEFDRYGLLDAPARAVFDRLARIAQRAFDSPVALVTVVGRDEQIFKAHLGTELCGAPRGIGFCGHVVAAKTPLVVPDATQDARFADDPLVAGEPGMRFYAGAPVASRTGHVLGTVCVLDTQPRQRPDAQQLELLEDLAVAVADAFELHRTTLELEAGERLYEQLGELASDAILVLAPDRTIEYANAYAGELFGYPDSRLLGMHADELMHPDEAATPAETFERLQAGEVIENERRLLRSDGGTVTAELRTRQLPNGTVQSAIRDVTEQRRRVDRLNAYARFRRGLVQLVGELMEAADERVVYQHLLDFAVRTVPGAQAGSIIVRSAEDAKRYRFAAAHGFDFEPLADTYLHEHELEWDPERLTAQVLPGFNRTNIDDAARSDAMWHAGPTADIRGALVAPAHHRNRTVAWLLLDNFETPEDFDSDSREMAMVVAQQLAALLQRVELDRSLRTAAFTDSLTGLPNRNGVTGILADRLRRARGTTVLFLDLDDFKVVNDGFGHAAGDALLQRVAERLTGLLRDDDTVARWAGDEFVVLLRDADSASDVALRLLRALSRPFALRQRDVFVRASVGIATAEDGVDAGELIEWADIALHHAKRAGKNRYATFEPGMRERLVLRRELEGDLRYALQHGELHVHYQPRVDLQRERVRSVEALARWTHPKRGGISPGVFIPLAEETGMIHELGQQVLDLACEQARAWNDAGTPLRVAVNISARQLMQPDFVAGIRAALERHRLSPERLELEITESVAASDGEGIASKLDQLNELGVHVSIDDFGTAYSSLSRLQRLPIQSLKIDQSFVRDLSGDEPQKATSLVQAIVTLARNLDLRVIAEGIETEAQRDILRTLGADEAQGYLFARPGPASEIDAAPSVGNDAPAPARGARPAGS